MSEPSSPTPKERVQKLGQALGLGWFPKERQAIVRHIHEAESAARERGRAELLRPLESFAKELFELIEIIRGEALSDLTPEGAAEQTNGLSSRSTSGAGPSQAPCR